MESSFIGPSSVDPNKQLVANLQLVRSGRQPRVVKGLKSADETVKADARHVRDAGRAALGRVVAAHQEYVDSLALFALGQAQAAGIEFTAEHREMVAQLLAFNNNVATVDLMQAARLGFAEFVHAFALPPNATGADPTIELLKTNAIGPVIRAMQAAAANEVSNGFYGRTDNTGRFDDNRFWEVARLAEQQAKLRDSLPVANDPPLTETDELNQIRAFLTWLGTEMAPADRSLPLELATDRDKLVTIEHFDFDSSLLRNQIARQLARILDVSIPSAPGVQRFRPTEREGTVLKGVFGIGADRGPKAEVQISKELGLSNSRVGQILDKAIGKILAGAQYHARTRKQGRAVPLQRGGSRLPTYMLRHLKPAIAISRMVKLGPNLSNETRLNLYGRMLEVIIECSSPRERNRDDFRDFCERSPGIAQELWRGLKTLEEARTRRFPEEAEFAAVAMKAQVDRMARATFNLKIVCGLLNAPTTDAQARQDNVAAARDELVTDEIAMRDVLSAAARSADHEPSPILKVMRATPYLSVILAAEPALRDAARPRLVNTSGPSFESSLAV